MANMVSVAEILQKVTASDDFRDFDGSPESYFMLMVDKLTGRPSVPQLVNSGIQPESFDPIQILVNDDGTWRFGDGHHRFLTALLRADDSVPVVHEYDNPETTAHEASSYHKFTESDKLDATWLASEIALEYFELLAKDASEESVNSDKTVDVERFG